MMINRRKFIGLISDFILAATSSIVLSLNTKKYLTLYRKRNLPFLLGWYDHIYNIDVSTQVSSKGIDLLIPYVRTIDKVKIQAFLDASKKVGVKVLLEIYPPLVKSKDILEIKDFIRTYKNHPSVYGWYLYDEPEIKKPTPLSPDLLKHIYRTIKEEDKSKPVALVFGDIKKIELYADAMDILMWDHYPCEEKVAEFQWVSAYRKALYKVISLADAKNKKFWNVLQAYSKKQFKTRLPTKAEFRYMFYLSVLAGADGLLFWIYSLSSHSWNESVLYPTVQEFRDYIPAIVREKNLSNSVQVSDSDIEVKLFSIPNTKSFVMIAINHNVSDISFNAKLPKKLARKVVVFNQKPITSLYNEADFSTALKAYEVCLYRIEMI